VVTGVVTGVLGSGLGWTARAGYERMLQKRPVAVRVDEDIKVVFPNTPAWISFPYFIPQLRLTSPLHQRESSTGGHGRRTTGGRRLSGRSP
jgi:hypothetical protein